MSDRNLQLGNVLPSISVFDTAYTRNSKPVLSSYDFVYSSIGSYFKNILASNLVVYIFLSLRSCCSAFPISVSHVIGVSSFKQMSWIATRSIVTMMTHAIFNFYCHGAVHRPFYGRDSLCLPFEIFHILLGKQAISTPSIHPVPFYPLFPKIFQQEVFLFS